MWFLWAAFGWGIGLIFQAAKAFNWAPFMNKNWEEKKIKEINIGHFLMVQLLRIIQWESIMHGEEH